MNARLMNSYPHHLESVVRVGASPAALFAELDDHDRLVSHMMRSSAMMAGSTMRFSYDEGAGRAIGSRIVMSGRMLGLDLKAEEVVTERDPPFRKSWETIGAPRLLVIGGYRMGFEIVPEAEHSKLRLFIDYEDAPPPWRWLGWLLGRAYARWCVENMAKGAATAFVGKSGEVQCDVRKKIG